MPLTECFITLDTECFGNNTPRKKYLITVVSGLHRELHGCSLVTTQLGVTRMEQTVTVIKRDQWQRPLIHPPDGGPAEPYVRVSTMAKVLDDQTMLNKWKYRMLLTGLQAREDLQLLLQHVDVEDKDALNALANDAFDASGMDKAANMGTVVHSWTEDIDRGKIPNVTAKYKGDLDAYQSTIHGAGITPKKVEVFVVNDELKCAGTFDRLYTLPNGKDVIGDVKTGLNAAAYGTVSAAIQESVYANSYLYNPETYERTPISDTLDKTVGIMVHLPLGQGKCELIGLDFVKAYRLAQLSAEVYQARATQISIRKNLNIGIQETIK